MEKESRTAFFPWTDEDPGASRLRSFRLSAGLLAIPGTENISNSKSLLRCQIQRKKINFSSQTPGKRSPKHVIAIIQNVRKKNHFFRFWDFGFDVLVLELEMELEAHTLGIEGTN